MKNYYKSFLIRLDKPVLKDLIQKHEDNIVRLEKGIREEKEAIRIIEEVLKNKY